MKIFNSIIALLLCISAIAQPGTWTRIGKEGDWINTTKAVQSGNKLYTIEKSGRLPVFLPVNQA